MSSQLQIAQFTQPINNGQGAPFYPAHNTSGMVGLDALHWLAEQGATFTLLGVGTKRPTLEGWQNTPYLLNGAVDHAKCGNNIGLLTGAPSRNIIALDRDVSYRASIDVLSQLARTAKVERTNAPDRGKFLYRIKGELPASTSWKQNRTDTHPAAEFLSTGRQAVIPPSKFGGGDYVLVDAHYGILELTPEQMERAWWLITGEPLDKNRRTKTEQPTDNNDFIQRVRGAWSAQAVFEHFGRTENGTKQDRAETRLLGNGGLLANDWRWYCHSDGMGGDQFDAWAYCKWDRIIDRQNKQMFWDVVNEMAEVANIERPRPLDGRLNGNQSSWIVAPDLPSGGEETNTPAQSNKADEGEQKKTSKAKDLYLFAKERAKYFTAQDGRAYALCPVEGHRECYVLNSRGFKGWLGHSFYQEHNQWMGRDTRSEVAEMLEMDAKKTQRDVCTRAGRQGDKLYIDLGTADWDAIEIDANGWRKISDPPVVFRRPSSMRAMPYPEQGGSIDLLAKYINAEPEDLPIIAAWGAYGLCFDGPFPILAFTGEQGTAKSTSVRVLKKLIDPDTAELRSMPREERDLIVAASGQRLLSFDNVTTIDRTTADALCRIATGGGFGKRANYTDDEEVTFKVKRPIVLNGIGDPVSANEDMMERAIIICPPVITDGKRRDEASFWAEFEQDKPKLLGFLLGVAVEGLAKLPTTTVSNLPRMADFTLFGVAAQDAYAPGGDFLQDYERNRTEANEIVIENSSVGEILRKLVLVSGGWKGTAAELLAKMNEHASEDERRSSGWPKAPNKVKQVLQRLAPSLRKIGVGGVGIEYVKSNGTKHIVLTRL